MLRHRLQANNTTAIALLITLGLSWSGVSRAEVPQAVDHISNETDKTDSGTSIAAEPVVETSLPNIPSDATPLQLDVKINTVATGLIAAFYQLSDGRIASTRGELKELGVVAPGEGRPEDLVILSDLPNVTYDFNEAEQLIDLNLDSSLRVKQEINAFGREAITMASSDRGILLNYSLYSALSSDYKFENKTSSGLASYLETRLFSEFGTLELSGVVATPDFKATKSTRFETTYAFEDPKRLIDYELGDIVSGSMNWTRSVRMGGGKARRNFGLRPDLVTMPLPQISGNAAVPSTLDVYIGGVKSYSKELNEGPFTVSNIPVYTNEGTAKVTLTDATGREVQSEGNFYTSPRLLRPKLFDFSIDAGFLREKYGKTSFDYANDPVAIANLRYGLTDILTGEAHAEASQDLQNGGVGMLSTIPNLGTFNIAAAASHSNNDLGFMLYGAWEKRLGKFSFNASTQRTFGNYQDLASVNQADLTGEKIGAFPRAVEQFGVGYALQKYNTGLGASFIHSENLTGEHNYIASGSFSTVYNRATISGSGFYNFGTDKGYGASISASMQLSPVYSTSSQGIHNNNGQELNFDISKSHVDNEFSTAGNVAYNYRDQKTAINMEHHREHQLNGRGEMRTPFGTADGSAILQKGGASLGLGFTGAAVATKHGVLFGRNVSDSFAVVNTGAKGVRVRHENRFIGKSDRNGLLLVPNVVPYANNKFDIDLDDLPLTAQMPESERFVVPRSKSGVIVNFNVTASEKAAIVILKDANGKFIEPSSEIMLDGQTEPFLMGYDGEAYLTGLADNNRITIKHKGGTCVATFGYSGDTQDQTVIGPIPCNALE